MTTDPLIYIIILDSGDVLAFRTRESAEAEADGEEIHEAYLQS